MDIELMFNKMFNYINSDASIYTISIKYREQFNKALKLIKEHINALDNEQFVGAYDAAVVEECVGYLKSVLINDEIDKIFKLFLNDFLLVVYNWNKNVYKSKVLHDKLTFLHRCLEDALSLVELVDVTNNVVNRVADFKTWLPPSFELSKHYYNLFKED